MKQLLIEVLSELNVLLESENQSRQESGALKLLRVQIRILGQMSLLLNEKVTAALHPVSTMDVDAFWEGDRTALELFRKCLKKHSLEYDNDSHLVWIPPESRYDPLFDAPLVQCEVIQPLYAIVSKAVKAPEKNRIIVRNAIGFFGEELIQLLLKYGVKPAEFFK